MNDEELVMLAYREDRRERRKYWKFFYKDFANTAKKEGVTFEECRIHADYMIKYMVKSGLFLLTPIEKANLAKVELLNNSEKQIG